MARGHGRILTTIWEDADFLALDQQQQRLYLFLISQPNLNHAGLLDLTLRRWSRKAAGLSVAALDKILAGLEQARFVVVDDDTEELLIRSFVRNDGVWRMPKVMGAMVSGALEISSPKLRRALLAEMDRIPLGELSSEPTKTTRGEGPSIRAQITEHIETLRRAFDTPDPDPSEGGTRTPSGTPSGTPSDTPHEDAAEGPSKPSTRGRAGAHVRAAPSPTPAPALSPSPDPLPSVVEVREETSGSSAADVRRPDGLHLIPDDFHLNDTMRRWVHSTFPGLDPDFETEQFIRYWRSEGRRKRNWHDAWQKWIADSHQRARERQQRSNVVPLPNTQQRPGGVRGRVLTADEINKLTLEDVL